jgi:hypothetical protein
MTGFGKGAFAVNGKAIALRRDRPDYYKGWKNLVNQKRSDLLGHLARVVFSAAAQARCLHRTG